MGERVAVCLSGGGHRAALFGLGALLYLTDSGRSARVVSVSSISGGSLTNGYVGLHTDFDTVDGPTFRRTVKPLAVAVSTGGTLWAGWLTYAYLAALVVVLAAAIVLTVLVGGAWPWLIWIVAVPLVGWLLSKRGWLARTAFDSTLFHGRPLSALHTRVDHVITATDLQLQRQVYFSGRFVNSYQHGWGEPGSAPLAFAVQASSCFPGGFPPARRRVTDHGFSTPRDGAPKRFMLVDGGVYDNMGTEWPMRLRARITEGRPPSPLPVLADELIVVNASAGVRGPTRRRLVPVPFVGELASLMADSDVLYAQTTAVRRRWMNAVFRGGDPAATPRDGAMIQIDRSPFDLPRQVRRAPGGQPDRRSRNAETALARLGDTEADWQAQAAVSSSIKTTLSQIDADRAARLLRHAYVLTMVNTHVLLDYPLLDVPTVESFLELVR